MMRWILGVAVVLLSGPAFAQQVKDGPWTNDKNLVRAFGVPQTPQKVATTTASARTGTDFTPNSFVMIICQDAAVHYKFGDSTVTATTSDQYWPADLPDIWNVGTHTRIAFRTTSGSGNCYVTEIKTVNNWP